MLFTSSGDVRVIAHNGPVRRLNESYVLVQMPIGRSVKEMARAFTADVGDAAKLKDMLEAAIKYKVAMRPVLSSLHEHLQVWDAKAAHPEVRDADIADIAGIRVNHDFSAAEIAQAKGEEGVRLEKRIRRIKQLTVQRHYRIATQYIENVALGKFPLRHSR